MGFWNLFKNVINQTTTYVVRKGEFNMTLTSIQSYAEIPVIRLPAAPPKQCTALRRSEICKTLNQFGICTEAELFERLPEVMKRLSMRASVFKNYETPLCYSIFQKAVQDYAKIKDTRIALGHKDDQYFTVLLEDIRKSPSGSIDKWKSDTNTQDLDRIGRSYDRFETSLRTLRETHAKLETMFESVEFAKIPHVILGLGDAGTTLWLEKYSQYHQAAKEQIDQQMLPEVLIIGQSVGSMKNSYALAQTHNVLDRGSGVSNPRDFISTATYEDNQFVDGKHLYQSNIVNLGKTGAPTLLQTTVTKIEKRENDLNDWHCANQAYRLRVNISGGREKLIYTNELDVCTGLGYAKKGLIQEIAGADNFETLSQFDEERGYAPLIDGDQYIFNFHERKSTNAKRTILIFGGGDTSAAAYRKAYFGSDFCLKEYSENERKNDVLWFSSHGFARVGKGKMPLQALGNARETGKMFEANLKRIEYDPDTKKLKVHVLGIKEGEEEWVAIECDQLIYSIGQDSEERGQLFHQLKEDVTLDFSPEQSLMGMKTADDRVHFLGAAAQTMGGKAYADAMFEWINRNHISDDSAAPAVLPPSRALIKHHAIRHGGVLKSVNANTDDLALVKQLLTVAGVGMEKSEAFMNDLIINRRRTESGMPRSILQGLIDRNGLSAWLSIQGHSTLEIQKQTA